MANGFGNIARIPELRKRLLWTLSLLAVYRIGVFVTVPGVDRGDGVAEGLLLELAGRARDHDRGRDSGATVQSEQGALEERWALHEVGELLRL